LSGTTGFAQEPYKLPPKAVLDIIDAPPTPRVSMNPARDTMLLIDSESMPAIAYLSQPIYRIAGIRITPLNNSVQVLSFSTGLTLKKVKDGTTKKIALPAGIRLAAPRWSADGQYAVFPRYLDNGIELWVLNAGTGEAKALTPATLNMVVGGGMNWTPDNRRVFVHMVPDGRGKEPEAPRVPIGPNVQVSGGKAVKTATYEDLLKSPYDEKLFDYYATSQIVEVDVTTGQSRKIGGPGVYTGVNPSPDGNYLIVTRIKRPYSYSVPYSGFARSYEIWSKNGDLVKVVADLPPNEGVPMNGVPTGPRGLDWQPLKPATLLWTEALDGGDPEKDVPFRDKFMVQPAPFTAEPKEVLKLQHRAGGLTWFATPGLALASESNWKKRWRTTYLVNIDQP
jgi:dipeptidyl aminopeptidase/acylaminoacyl peptidase